MNFLPLNFALQSSLHVQLVYLACCFLVAVAGRKRRMGFWGNLFCSIVLSPVVGLLIVLVSGKRE